MLVELDCAKQPRKSRNRANTFGHLQTPHEDVPEQAQSTPPRPNGPAAKVSVSENPQATSISRLVDIINDADYNKWTSQTCNGYMPYYYYHYYF